MNVPGIKDPLKRRLHLVWIVPYMVVAFVPMLLWYGFKELPALCVEIPTSLRDVWVGRRRG